MDFWNDPAVIAAAREIVIAILLALLGLLGYRKTSAKIAALTRHLDEFSRTMLTYHQK